MDAVAEARAVWPGAATLVTVQEILDSNKCGGESGGEERWRGRAGAGRPPTRAAPSPSPALPRVLVAEIDRNHDLRTPDALARNCALIRELNRNVAKVGGRGDGGGGGGVSASGRGGAPPPPPAGGASAGGGEGGGGGGGVSASAHPAPPPLQVVALYDEISTSFGELVDGAAAAPSVSGGAAAAAARGGEAPSSSPSAAGGGGDEEEAG